MTHPTKHLKTACQLCLDCCEVLSRKRNKGCTRRRAPDKIRFRHLHRQSCWRWLARHASWWQKVLALLAPICNSGAHPGPRLFVASVTRNAIAVSEGTTCVCAGTKIDTPRHSRCKHLLGTSLFSGVTRLVECCWQCRAVTQGPRWMHSLCQAACGIAMCAQAVLGASCHWLQRCFRQPGPCQRSCFNCLRSRAAKAR